MSDKSSPGCHYKLNKNNGGGSSPQMAVVPPVSPSKMEVCSVCAEKKKRLYLCTSCDPIEGIQKETLKALCGDCMLDHREEFPTHTKQENLEDVRNEIARREMIEKSHSISPVLRPTQNIRPPTPYEDSQARIAKYSSVDKMFNSTASKLENNFKQDLKALNTLKNNSSIIIDRLKNESDPVKIANMEYKLDQLKKDHHVVIKKYFSFHHEELLLKLHAMNRSLMSEADYRRETSPPSSIVSRFSNNQPRGKRKNVFARNNHIEDTPMKHISTVSFKNNTSNEMVVEFIQNDVLPKTNFAVCTDRFFIEPHGTKELDFQRIAANPSALKTIWLKTYQNNLPTPTYQNIPIYLEKDDAHSPSYKYNQ